MRVNRNVPVSAKLGVSVNLVDLVFGTLPETNAQWQQ